MSTVPSPRAVKNFRITIRCRRETLTRWKVNLADSTVDGESYLNGLIDYWRTTHAGTARPMPGKTFGQMLGAGQR